ncbi:Hsp20/alpha crystallin family protein [Candidatus Margulisiibacteriota bacterium]
MNLVRKDYYPLNLWEDIFDISPFFERKGAIKNFTAPVEIEADEKNIYVKTEVPGIDKKDIEIEYDNGLLTISGEKKIERKGKEEDYKYSELSAGKFKRSLNLDTEVNFQKATAEYKNGVLEITLPKTESKKAQKLLVG